LQGLARAEGVDTGRANREAMPDITAKRTLVKSPPELWSELSEVDRLAKHLGAFGEIKITKLEPEHTVAWEGESASGTVSIEPSGWGTKVTLTAQLGDELGARGGCEDEPPMRDACEDEPPAVETAAWDGERAEAVDWEPDGLGSFVDEPVAHESETGVTEGFWGEEGVAIEPVAPEPVVADAVPAEPAVEEPVEAPDPEPVPPKPWRERGLLAWLFRPRTSAQVAGPAVANPSEPVVEAPVDEEPPVLEEPPVVEEPPMREEPPFVEEPPLMEEPPVQEEPPFVEEPPVMEEPPPLQEEPPLVEEPPVMEVPPVQEEALMVDDSPVVDEGPAEGARPERAPDEVPLAQPPLPAHARPAEEPPDPGLGSERAQAILDEALDALGSAHHRPFSRG